MTVILMKNTAAGRRAYAISNLEAEQLVAAGDAVQDKVHTGIYEEVTDDERDQGYMTRNMAPIPHDVIKRKPGRPPKVRPSEVDEPPAAPVEE
jgi:hypothetical protein